MTLLEVTQIGGSVVGGFIGSWAATRAGVRKVIVDVCKQQLAPLAERVARVEGFLGLGMQKKPATTPDGDQDDGSRAA